MAREVRLDFAVLDVFPTQAGGSKGVPMRHLMLATAVVLASTATPPELRGETKWSVEGGLAVWQNDQSTAQLGAAVTMGSAGPIGGRISLAMLPQFFAVGARGALLDGAVVFPIELTPRLTLEPGFGPSVLGVWMGLGGV